MEKKDSPPRTIDIAKKERQVASTVKEELKQYNRMKRAIRHALEEGPLTIPELADKLSVGRDEVTYYLMSMRKYGFVSTGELDDMDEYFSYHLKK
jgi:predicted transcriptional regulator